MKYGDIINARREYIKFNEGYQWAIMTLKVIEADLREKYKVRFTLPSACHKFIDF